MRGLHGLHYHHGVHDLHDLHDYHGVRDLHDLHNHHSVHDLHDLHNHHTRAEKTLGPSSEALSSVGPMRRCDFFLNASGPRPSYPLVARHPNLIPLLWQGTSYPCHYPTAITIASKLMLTSESQALLRPASRPSNHVTVAPLAAFINNAKEFLLEILLALPPPAHGFH